MLLYCSSRIRSSLASGLACRGSASWPLDIESVDFTVAHITHDERRAVRGQAAPLAPKADERARYFSEAEDMLYTSRGDVHAEQLRPTTCTVFEIEILAIP